MRSTLSDECLSLHEPISISRIDNNTNSSSDHRPCDACSYQFTMWPSAHYAGNMFVARCNYIRKLIPPKLFEAKKQALADRIMNSTKVQRRSKKHLITTAIVQRSGSIQEWNSSDTPIPTTPAGNSTLTGETTIQFVYRKRSEFQLNRESWLGRKLSYLGR